MVRAGAVEAVRLLVINPLRGVFRVQRIPVRSFVGVHGRARGNDALNEGEAIGFALGDGRNGVFMLAVEWRASVKQKDMSGGVEDLRRKAIELCDEELLKEVDEFKNISSNVFYSTRNSLYLYGFYIIVAGVLMQISANGIAWAAAYGLIS